MKDSKNLKLKDKHLRSKEKNLLMSSGILSKALTKAKKQENQQ